MIQTKPIDVGDIVQTKPMKVCRIDGNRVWLETNQGTNRWGVNMQYLQPVLPDFTEEDIKQAAKELFKRDLRFSDGSLVMDEHYYSFVEDTLKAALASRAKRLDGSV